MGGSLGRRHLDCLYPSHFLSVYTYVYPCRNVRSLRQHCSSEPAWMSAPLVENICLVEECMPTQTCCQGLQLFTLYRHAPRATGPRSDETWSQAFILRSSIQTSPPSTQCTSYFVLQYLCYWPLLHGPAAQQCLHPRLPLLVLFLKEPALTRHAGPLHSSVSAGTYQIAKLVRAEG